MDVVCRNIEFIGGCIEIELLQGEGFVFYIYLLFMFVIVDGMCVLVGD